jgi:hypothetical protein
MMWSLYEKRSELPDLADPEEFPSWLVSDSHERRLKGYRYWFDRLHPCHEGTWWSKDTNKLTYYRICRFESVVALRVLGVREAFDVIEKFKIRFAGGRFSRIKALAALFGKHARRAFRL